MKKKITYLQYFYIKTLAKDKFNNIKATITNNIKGINLDLINEKRKKIYKKILKRNYKAKKDLDNNMIGLSI